MNVLAIDLNGQRPMFCQFGPKVIKIIGKEGIGHDGLSDISENISDEAERSEAPASGQYGF
jgi:hypothetical protein